MPFLRERSAWSILVVAPPPAVDLDRSGTVTEKDFRLFLRKRAPAKAPPHASTAGRKADYFYDYVFTANFFVMTGR